MLNKNKSITFFIFSFLALILFPFFIALLSVLLHKVKPSNTQVQNINQYLNTLPYDTSDPYITRVPTLKSLISEPIVSNDDPMLGNKEALITIVQFSDFNCKFCQEQFQILNKIIMQYQDKIKFIRKDYPEYNQESASYQSAIAARCAQEQNKFWEFHNELYLATTTLDKNLFINTAKKINLNKNQFITCLDQPQNAITLIQNNIEEANALDINGVPFIYINKQEFMGSVSEESLEKIIQKELNKNN